MPTHRHDAGGKVPPRCRAEVVAQSLLNWGGLSQVEETVDVVPPLPQGVWRGCLSRGVAKQLPSRYQRSAARSL